ncbi:hypothetical protein [Halocatena halophila]|uniref:hypothetical protein n=1 Tax=Halocatena halophila TaxID=2814576 RepID=UPI002ED5D922
MPVFEALTVLILANSVLLSLWAVADWWRGSADRSILGLPCGLTLLMLGFGIDWVGTERSNVLGPVCMGAAGLCIVWTVRKRRANEKTV